MGPHPIGLVSLWEGEMGTELCAQGKTVQAQGEGGHLGAKERGWPCGHLDLRSLAYGSVRKQISLV